MSGATLLKNVVLHSVAYAAFISLGLPDAVNGVAWPSVRHSFNLPHAALGALAVISTLSYLVSSLYTPRLLSRFGVGMLLMGSTSLVALGLLGYSTAPARGLFLLGAFLNGTGSGAIDTSLNTYAAKHFSLRSMNWLHGFYMVGAGLGPAVMTTVLAQGLSWRTGYGILAGALAVLSVLFVITRTQWEDEGQSPATAVEQKESPVNLGEAMRSKPLLLQALLFFLHTAVEVTTGLWCYTYMVEHRGYSTAFAGMLTTAYWGVFAGGRFLLGAAAHHFGPVRLVRVGVLLAATGAVVFALAPARLAGMGLVGIGLGLAPVFPTLMSCTPQRVGKRLTSLAVGVQVSASSIGAAVMPAVAGVIATQVGISLIPVVIVGAAAALVALHEVLLTTCREAVA